MVRRRSPCEDGRATGFDARYLDRKRLRRTSLLRSLHRIVGFPRLTTGWLGHRCHIGRRRSRKHLADTLGQVRAGERPQHETEAHGCTHGTGNLFTSKHGRTFK
jgi:hypothetical protein